MQEAGKLSLIVKLLFVGHFYIVHTTFHFFRLDGVVEVICQEKEAKRAIKILRTDMVKPRIIVVVDMPQIVCKCLNEKIQNKYDKTKRDN